MAEKIRLLATAELPIGESRCVNTPIGTIALFRREEGFFALDNECPHRGGPMSEGLVKDGTVSCPWHQWTFRFENGTCTNIPGVKIKNHPVEIIDGGVWIAG